jgi:pimeloyl-ACP methyl ester carboxylesterase
MIGWTWLAAWWAAAGPSIGNDGAPRAPDYPDHTRLLVVRDERNNEHEIRSSADWAVRRAHVLAHLQEVMGPLPGGERRVPLDVRILETHEAEEFLLRKISYAAEPGDRVEAWLFLPRGREGRRPAMLCLHQTIAIGKDEPAGRGGSPNLHYAQELARRGFVTLSPDYPGFGSNRADPYALGYASASMKGIWNHMRAVDVLWSLDEVDGERLGVIGHSLGGHNAIFVALFDERIKAVATSCGFNAFTHYEKGDVSGWSHKGYMPRLREAYALDLARIPFDFPELLAALAPRHVFVSAPLGDDNFPVEGVKLCVESALPVFELLGSPGRLRVEYPQSGHDFPEATRSWVYEGLEAALAP